MSNLSKDEIECQIKSAFADFDSALLEKQRDAFVLLRHLSAEIPDSHINILFKDELFKRIVCFINADEYEQKVKPLADDEYKENLINLISLATEVLAACWKRYRLWVTSKSTGLELSKINHLPGIIYYDENIRNHSNDQIRATTIRVLSDFSSPEDPADREIVRFWLEPILNHHQSPSVRIEALRVLSLFGLAGDLFDVFLCHNSKDKDSIRELNSRLKDRGIKTWLDEEQLRPGIPWQDELERQIQGIKAVVVAVGSSGTGPWQDVEIRAFLEEFVRRGCPVIPLILPDCTSLPKLPLFLNQFTWIDLRKQKPDPFKLLVWGITGRKQ